MLQINTGKLYVDGVGRSQTIRGIFYSNLCLRRMPELQTAAGSVIAADHLRGTNALILQMEERLPDGREQSGVLVSHGADPYVLDFAHVTSFYFNAVAHPDADLVRQLLAEVPSLVSHKAPRDYIARCFEKNIFPTDEELKGFAAFVDDLLGLGRRDYLAAIRAIRTYVAATHRLRDQLDAAYALMVSSVEGLVGDAGETAWEDLAGDKRATIDAALGDVSEAQAEKIRRAIVQTEQRSIGPRYREFMKRHALLANAYAEEVAHPATGSCARDFELEAALRNAYGLRSMYLHQSKPLPSEIAHVYGYHDVVYCDRWATLSFQGLAKFTRRAIRGFVKESPKVEAEAYNYHMERAGVIQAKMHPSTWLHLPLASASEGKIRFEGLLTVVVEMFSSAEDPALPDLRGVMKDIERVVPQAAEKVRVPLVAQYHLYNHMLEEDLRTPGYEDWLAKFTRPESPAASEWVAARSLTGHPIELSLEAHQSALDSYFARRSKPGGLHAPPFVEVAMCLVLADRYHQLGRTGECQQAIAQAISAAPQVDFLRDLVVSADRTQPIEWRRYLCPALSGNDQNVDHPFDPKA